MCWRNTDKKFGIVTKFLHWSLALLFLGQFVWLYESGLYPNSDPAHLKYILLHKSFGVLILGVVLTMLLWRIINTRPTWPNTMPLREQVLAKLTHRLIYLVMILMPVSGYLMSCYAGYGVKFFGMALPVLVGKDEGLGQFFFDMHERLAYLILILVSLHTLGALKHHFIDKNDILRRML